MNGASADPAGDSDGDQLVNMLEYALATDPGHRDTNGVAVMVTPLTVNGITADYFTAIVRRQVGAEDIAYQVLFSADLENWLETGLLAASTFNGDGTVTELWRSPNPAAAYPKLFARVRVTSP